MLRLFGIFLDTHSGDQCRVHGVRRAVCKQVGASFKQSSVKIAVDFINKSKLDT